MDSGPQPEPAAFALLVADIYDAAGVLRRYGERVLGSITGQAQRGHQVLLARLGQAGLAEVRTVLRRLTATVRAELEPGGPDPA